MTAKSELKELSQIRRELAIEIDAAQVAHELDHVLKEIAATARIPGFRQGKVPRNILRKRFQREIEQELLEHLVPPALKEAFAEKGVWPVHQPVIRDVVLADGKALAFTAAFEIKPKIDPGDYRGLLVRAAELKVEETHVDQELETLRQGAATYVPAEPHPLTKGDHAIVDLERREGDEVRKQENALIEVGSEDFHPQFTLNLMGMSPGDTRTFDVSYGDDEPEEAMRGKTVSYTLHLRELKKRQLPDLDDDFAQDGGRYQTLAEMKAAIRTELEAQAEHRVRADQERQVAEALVSRVDAELPQSLVEVELDRMLEEQVRALMMRGVDPRTAPVDWRAVRDRMREQAERNVKWELVLDSIAERESIAVGDDDVEARLKRIAAGSERSLEFVRSKIQKDGRMDEIKKGVRLEKTVDFLLRNAKIERR